MKKPDLDCVRLRRDDLALGRSTIAVPEVERITARVNGHYYVVKRRPADKERFAYRQFNGDFGNIARCAQTPGGLQSFLTCVVKYDFPVDNFVDIVS
jgi:hypothetical protein